MENVRRDQSSDCNGRHLCHSTILPSMYDTKIHASLLKHTKQTTKQTHKLNLSQMHTYNTVSLKKQLLLPHDALHVIHPSVHL